MQYSDICYCYPCCRCRHCLPRGPEAPCPPSPLPPSGQHRGCSGARASGAPRQQRRPCRHDPATACATASHARCPPKPRGVPPADATTGDTCCIPPTRAQWCPQGGPVLSSRLAAAAAGSPSCCRYCRPAGPTRCSRAYGLTGWPPRVHTQLHTQRGGLGCALAYHPDSACCPTNTWWPPPKTPASPMQRIQPLIDHTQQHLQVNSHMLV